MALVPATSRASASGELAYVEYSNTVTVSATTSGTAQAIVSAGAVTFDGSTAVLIEYYGPFHSCAATATLNVALFLDTAFVNVLGILNFTNAGKSPLHLVRRTTPTSGSHTYEIRMYRGTANWTVDANGGGALLPGFIRISRA